MKLFKTTLMRYVSFTTILLSIAILLTGCPGDPDESGDEISNTSWETVYVEYESEDDNEYFTYTTKTKLKENKEYDLINFNSDKTFYNSFTAGTWSLSGNKLTIKYEMDGHNVSEIYILVDDIMTCTEIEEDYKYIIKYERINE